jgi:hypothetical protein
LAGLLTLWITFYISFQVKEIMNRKIFALFFDLDSTLISTGMLNPPPMPPIDDASEIYKAANAPSSNAWKLDIL